MTRRVFKVLVVATCANEVRFSGNQELARVLVTQQLEQSKRRLRMGMHRDEEEQKRVEGVTEATESRRDQKKKAKGG